MTTATITHLSQQTVALYADAARAIVGAYRDGAERLLGRVEGRLAGGLGSERVAISAPLKQSLLDAERQIAGLVRAGLQGVAAAADQIVNATASVATTGVKTVAAAGAQVQQSLPGDAGSMLVALNLPAAQLSHDVAARVAGTVRKVSERIGRGESVVDVEEVVAAPRAAATKRARAARKS
ncbi:MAG: hypothetical protein JSR59_15835 [Proteobacteria bacterium]|nr:hypothetical protein [Pseudomonadota bacterium]